LRWISALGSRSATTELVAGALDQDAPRREPIRHGAPRGSDLGLVVLPQHIGRPDDDWALAGGRRHLEPTPGERDPGRRQHRGLGDALRVELQAEHAHGSTGLPGQPLGELQGGDRAGPEPQVDHERIRVRAQRRTGAVQDPAVEPAQPIGVRRPPRDRAQRRARADGHHRRTGAQLPLVISMIFGRMSSR
jgi:hypothetical protein